MTRQELPEDAGYIVLPKRLGWAVVVAFAAFLATAVSTYHATTNRVEAISRASDETAKLLAITIIEKKAKDAELSARIDSLRELAYTQQGAILSRLTRIETILERFEKNGRP